MQTIKKDELFRNLGKFLKSKGIELQEGSYSNRIRKGCDLLSEAINTTQKTVKRTKEKVDETLDELRQTIHEQTAPTPPAAHANATETPRKSQRVKIKVTTKPVERASKAPKKRAQK